MKPHVLFALALVPLFTACQMPAYRGEPRDVKRRPQEGGIVAIARDHRPEDRQRAEEAMRGVCAPNAFRVIEEGEIVTGQEVVSNRRETNRANSERSAGMFLGMPVTTGDQGGSDAQTSSTTKNMSEWQISYACEKPAVAPAPAAKPGKKTGARSGVIKSIVVQRSAESD